ncbi:MAG TPA: PqiC family protein [Candidatus Binataceae bacterium]|nr:PqiC family protein [Candidatus Binataceae bacterium]
MLLRFVGNEIAPAVLAILLGMLVAGCSSVLAPLPDPTHYFILSADSPAASSPQSAAANASAKLVIGLGPVNFPDYLARSEMVTRLSEDRLAISSDERWAEPLDVSFKRVLAHDLSNALNGAQVAVFPWVGETLQPNYLVEMTVDRFDTDAQGAAQLVARWTVSATNPTRVVYSSTSVINVPASSGADRSAAVGALNQAVSQYGGELAAAIFRLNRRG